MNDDLEKALEESVSATLALVGERGKTHGKFSDHARITQSFKRLAHAELYRRHQRGQPPLTDQQNESIDMILHKLGRIIAGESGFADHWADIAGYAEIANKEF